MTGTTTGLITLGVTKTLAWVSTPILMRYIGGLVAPIQSYADSPILPQIFAVIPCAALAGVFTAENALARREEEEEESSHMRKEKQFVDEE